MANYPESFVYEIVIATKCLSVGKHTLNCVIICSSTKFEIIESKPELDKDSLVSIAVY